MCNRTATRGADELITITSKTSESLAGSPAHVFTMWWEIFACSWFFPDRGSVQSARKERMTYILERRGLPRFRRARSESRRHRKTCLLYTSDAADERSSVDLGGRRII